MNYFPFLLSFVDMLSSEWFSKDTLEYVRLMALTIIAIAGAAAIFFKPLRAFVVFLFRKRQLVDSMPITKMVGKEEQTNKSSEEKGQNMPENKNEDKKVTRIDELFKCEICPPEWANIVSEAMNRAFNKSQIRVMTGRLYFMQVENVLPSGGRLQDDIDALIQYACQKKDFGKLLDACQKENVAFVSHIEDTVNMKQ